MPDVPSRGGSRDDLLARLTIAALLLVPAAAIAHNPKELAGEFVLREKAFQPVDKRAPDFTLVDATGNRRHLSDFAGKVVVLYFVPGSCGSTCPLLADRIAAVQQMTKESGFAEGVQFLAVATDEDAGALRAGAEAQGLDPRSWMVLSSPPGPVNTARTLAERYGNAPLPADRNAAQVVLTHVLDGEGRWRGNFRGTDFLPVNMLMYVNALLHADNKQPTLWRRFLGWF